MAWQDQFTFKPDLTAADQKTVDAMTKRRKIHYEGWSYLRGQSEQALETETKRMLAVYDGKLNKSYSQEAMALLQTVAEDFPHIAPLEAREIVLKEHDRFFRHPFKPEPSDSFRCYDDLATHICALSRQALENHNAANSKEAP